MNFKYIFTSLALFFSFLFITKLIITKRKNNNKKKKNLPPSPPNSLPILGHLHLLDKPLHRSLARLSSHHGPILLLRFGVRRVLVVSSAPLADECFTTNDLSFATRPKFTTTAKNSHNFTTIGSTPYGPLWRDMRRTATVQVLSGHRLSFFSYVRADEARALARRLFLDSAREDFTRVELRPRLFGFAMNVMMQMTFGKRYYGEESDDNDARHFKKMMEESFALAGASNVGDFLPSAFGWLARRRALSRKAHIHTFNDTFMQALIEERRRNIKEDNKEEEEEERKHKTMIDAILSLQRIYPEQYNDRYIKSLVHVSLILNSSFFSSRNRAKKQRTITNKKGEKKHVKKP